MDSRDGAQWLANRASTGEGKKFLNPSNTPWGQILHKPLLDAVDWAVKQGVTRKEKVAILRAVRPLLIGRRLQPPNGLGARVHAVGGRSKANGPLLGFIGVPAAHQRVAHEVRTVAQGCRQRPAGDTGA